MKLLYTVITGWYFLNVCHRLSTRKQIMMTDFAMLIFQFLHLKLKDVKKINNKEC